MNNEFIAIGKIVNTQGHRGEVRVIPMTDFPERFYEMEEVLVQQNGKTRAFHIDSARPHKQFIIVKFREIVDMNAAERLKDAYIVITRDQLKELPPDTWYIHDLLGMTVITDTGEKIGTLVDVFSTGANDVYVVKPADGGKDILLPAIKDVILSVDTVTKTMTVYLMPGLVDEDEI
ncbi:MULTISPECIES: ribosome maturation factor RimM [Carboxydocella]|uniref:Ribosome maturation factor RimM n=2 Tax=Carboxydocella TaxID=178898 RepID=A0A1T4PXL7_9FIRM|nr:MULTISPECIES: ribosome maturation factor RimM [Carboxydocella]AVX20486.1 16S rRNA processing protein RimM [Carboxydocella thermautotrophica]AVX30907.1 16S rRNA processing protein RimM [Carboxydocella thermautotrophica]SJZ96233.1 16S rRNA processing protein RimM [Carboxydocella sporoproducens DSM 16521]GAW29697.1 16S rRNA processing protein RimM [Carboxydocella sp. ULO1]GAW32227.1 16S rRNA processing protein RimM [Carboxydocella sp. JDF658]